ncbi:MAG TPA: hypothetical protein VF899_16575 [Pyrinomonadaceae bacterium]
MKTLVLFLLTSLTYLPPSYRASSTMRCMIEPKSVKVALKQSAAVFSGEVLEMKNGGNYIEARLRVERSWKGVEAEEVSVLADSTTESPHYRVGQKYLVFAGIRDGKLFTGNCSRTKKLEYAQGDLQELGESIGESKGQKKKQE